MSAVSKADIVVGKEPLPRSMDKRAPRLDTLAVIDVQDADPAMLARAVRPLTPAWFLPDNHI